MLKCFSLLLSQVPLVDGGESLFSEEELLAELPPLSEILGMPATEAGGEHAYHHGGYEYLVDDRDLIKAGQGWTCACPCVRWLCPNVRCRLVHNTLWPGCSNACSPQGGFHLQPYMAETS